MIYLWTEAVAILAKYMKYLIEWKVKKGGIVNAKNKAEAIEKFYHGKISKVADLETIGKPKTYETNKSI